MSSCFDFAPLQRGKEILLELEQWNKELSKTNRLLKYSKMICGEFSFYRGTNHLFWRDFANHPALEPFGNQETQVWIQGDLHAENFGSFHNDEGKVIYDLNDFDESVITDYQYDLWRMAVSLVLLAQQHKFSPDKQAGFVEKFCKGYLGAIALYAEDPNAINIEFSAKNTYGKLDDFLEDVEKNESREDMLAKWTNVDGGDRYCDLELEKLKKVSKAKYKTILKQMPEYGKTLTGELAYCPEYFHVKDIAQRLLAGTGSLGTERYYVLIQGEEDEPQYDCILDLKAQGKPTPYYYLGKAFQEDYDQRFKNDAQRHAIAYKALIKNTDNHLGWLTLHGKSYSVRERSPYKEAFPLDTLTKTKRLKKMAEQWGKILASSHCRAAETMLTKTAIAFAQTISQLTADQTDQFITLIQNLASSYAAQVAFDYQAFKDAHPDLECLE